MMRSLAEELRAEGGLIADAVDGDGAAPRDVRGFVLDSIREGYRLHYAEGGVVRTDDRDLALLAGDRLYALGLARLAEAGDLEAVRILADLISECAQAHAELAPQRADEAWAVAEAALRGAH
jgi:hypothetical protein